jgi:hypothetical protein
MQVQKSPSALSAILSAFRLMGIFLASGRLIAEHT